MSAPPRKQSKKLIAAFVLIEAGIRDPNVIADAVGLAIGQVAEIVATTDTKLRRQAINGIPNGFTFSLRSIVRCPGCRQRITIAPCMTCRVARSMGPGTEKAVDQG